MTSEPFENLYTLILERDSTKPAAEIGRLLACHMPLHPTDAIAQIRYGGGLVVESVPEETADELSSCLLELGVRTRKIEAARWAVQPRGFKAFALEFLPDTLHVRLVSGRELVLLRNDLKGVHLHAFLTGEDSKAREQAAVGPADFRTEMPLPENRDGEEGEAWGDAGALESESSTLLPGRGAQLTSRGRALFEKVSVDGRIVMEFYLTLYSADPVGPVRIRKNEFDYSCLKEDRKEHSLDNFLALLEKILRYLPGAWNRKAAEQFLLDLDPQKILYFKEEEAQNFDRWMLQWVRIEAEERDGKRNVR